VSGARRPQTEQQQPVVEYTTKQRLREEIDSPFRKVRVVFFGFSAASALVALYFSLLTAGKAFAGWADAPPTSVALTDVAVNAAGVAVCSFLAYRDVKAGEANLARIARGGALAALQVRPADGRAQRPVGSFRNAKRVVVAAGGRDFLETLAASLTDTLAEALDRVNVVVIPVFLDDDDRCVVDATREVWRGAQDGAVFSDKIVHFPAAGAPWTAYLASEIATARKQRFDPQTKGLGIYVKKNGRILRRATGQPNWDAFIGTMEVMDGDQFGAPPKLF